MIRPSLLIAAVAVLAAAPGCDRRDVAPSPFSAAPPAPIAARRAPPGTGAAGPAFDAAPPAAQARDRAAMAAECRRDADRVVLYRDRGQLMREDERDARIGTDQSIYARRVETDRLGRLFERDRLAAECLQQQNTAVPPRR